ncbi:neuron navigator 3-like isoform X4 [Lineus longissimus]|uniref:neuron navigator 3-like isoform X4 n=1 Tax=Lineus longissimus TaxID=88925 RepID=UPI00315C57F4
MAAEADPDSDEGIQEDEEFDYEKGPKIYTDWANHYLEKARNKRFITDLQQDISDGVLLADVIEAVTNEKVRDIKSKPRNSAQMVDNINACLCFLSNLGVNVEGLSAKDIKEGNLKAILGLFFSLSRYKQQQKHATQVASTRNVNANVTAESQSKLPSPYSGKQSSKCPTVTNPSTKDAPGGANLNKNKSHSFNAADRNKTLLNQANNNTLSLSPGTASKNNNPSSRETSSSRSTSPSNVSNIPTPGGRGLGLGRSQSLSDKYGHRIVNSTSTSSASSAASGTSRSTSGYSTSASSTTGRIPSNKNSMLDKFKFFGSKDKTGSKSGVPAKASSKSSTSSRDSDTLRSSYSDSRPGSARNSAHEPISAQAGSASPKTSKSLKKSLGKALTSSKREGSPKPSKGKDDSIPRGKTPPPNAGRMVQPMATSSVSSSDRASSRGSPPSSRRSSSALQAPRSVSKSDMKSGQASPDAGKKGSKASSMIPKNAAKTNGKPAASTGLNSPNSHIPMPNTAIPKPSGIAKPGAKAAMHKDERRLKNDSKHGSRSQLHASTSKHNGMIPNNHESASLGSHDRSRDHRDSREQSSRHHDLDQKSVASHSSSSHRADSSHSRSSQGQGQSADHAHSKENPSRLNNNLVSQSHHDQRGDRNANMSAAESSSRLQRGARQSQEPTTPQGHSSNSQLPTHTNSLPRKMVSSGGTQTNASSLQRQQKHREQIQQHHEQQQQLHHQQQQHSSHSQQPQHHTQQPQHHVQQQQHHAQQPQHHAQQHLQQQSSSQVRSLDRKERTPQSGATAKLQRTENKIDNRKSSKANAEHRRDSNDSRSHSSSNSHSNSGTSSNDSVIYNPSCDELSTDSDARRSASQKQKNTQGNASPEVGMTPHNKYVKHTIPKNNKVETTFDSDVRTETVHTNSLPKGSGRKETTIAEDGGETMDVKPMQPIMTRSSPAYGYLRTGPANKSYGMYSSLNYSSGRLGLHRPLIPDGSKYFSLKRTMSGCSNTNSSNVPDDYGSDIEGYDVAAGYMSDGDILRPNAHVEDFSGYMSEGGASLYAKRMQQRFREGIEAVEECMRKSSGLIDDDSFDDSSSISSGDISDTIGDISTDENLTGSSVSASSDYHHPYGSLKRPPKPDINTLVGKTGSYYGAKTSYIGNKNLNHADYDYTAWRKYNGEQQHNYVNLDYSSEPDTSTLSHWRKERNDLKSCYATTNSLRRHSDAQTIKASAENLVQHDGGSKPMKVDSETNTDASLIMMHKQGQRPGQMPAGANFGFRRPVSGASTSSIGSSMSASAPRPVSGKPPSMSNSYDSSSLQRNGRAVVNGSQTQGQLQKDPKTDMGPEAYSSSTLERNPRRSNMVPSNTQTGLNVVTSSSNIDFEQYKSNTLGRKKPGDSNLKDRLFGSRGSLNKSPVQNTDPLIIGNPHATFGSKGQNSNGQVQQTKQNQGSGRSDYAALNMPYMNNYVGQDYHPGHSRPLSGVPNPTHPSNWLKNTPHRHGLSLSETESMESLSSAGSSVQAQIQQARAHSMATRNILSHNRDSFTYGVDRNGHSSNKSERLSQTLSQHLDGDLPRTSSYQQINQSQPSSPTPSVGSQSSSRFTYPMTALSPTMVQSASTHSLVRSSSQQSNLPYAGIGMPLTKSGSRDEEVHGSQLSLVSSSSSLYSANPIRKLRRELESAQEKVLTLTSQLSTNAHVVAAFEQSLSNMTTRLQSLTVTAEQKDSELTDLRITIESLRKQSGGITCEALDRTPVIPRRSSSLKPEQQVTSPSDAQNLSRQISSDSMSSINSLSSACSVTSQQSSITESDKKKGKKGKGSWLRSSFSKAFSSNKNKKSKGSASDLDETSSMHSDISVPNSPLLQGLHSNMPGTPLSGMKLSNSSHALGDDEECRVLQKQLQEKDMKLTDIRLEALSSAHQLEQLRETMTRMKTEMSSLKQDNKRLHTMVSSQNSLNRLDGSYGNLELSENEMSTLKADNDRLQRMVHSGSKPSSPSSPCAPMTLSPKGSDDLDKRLSLGEDHASNLDMLLNDSSDRDGRRISISVYSGNETDVKQLMEIRPPEIYLGTMSVSGKIRWDMLDSIVKRIFKDYCIRVDPVSHLGLNSESVLCYHIGEIIRIKGSNAKDPELLPCGYLVGEDMSIKIVLKGSQHNSVDNVAFETLIPKSIIQRYISLLIEHRRIILCGPSGTGKTYLAQKLATYLVLRSGKELAPTAIATFNVDHKSSKELRQYLTNIAEQCESSSASELPSVVILDNLHHVGSLGEVFNGFLSCKYLKCPYIIGTMNQATCSTTNLQLHHNFRWVLCANHMEPVKGFLGRYLRRKLIEAEVKTGMRNNDLNKMSEWMPKVWQHLNKFLETHSSSDVTIGPRLFLSCPMDMSGSQVWFTDLWNYSIVPYMLEAVREGLQVRNLYGRRAPWEDPAEWVIETYPWGPTNDGHSEDWPSLQRLRPEDVGYDTQGMVGEGKAKATQQAQSDVEGDPLLNMLMRLQEAASYSSPQSNDSDNTSLDSHSTNDMNKSDHGSSSRTNSGSVESTI